jgi:hypothetical protein
MEITVLTNTIDGVNTNIKKRKTKEWEIDEWVTVNHAMKVTQKGR